MCIKLVSYWDKLIAIFHFVFVFVHFNIKLLIFCLLCMQPNDGSHLNRNLFSSTWYIYIYIYIRGWVKWKHYIYIYIYTGCPRRKGPNFGRVFIRSNCTDITQNTYIQSSMVTEIFAREVWNFDSYYPLIDFQIHIETGRNMWFL